MAHSRIWTDPNIKEFADLLGICLPHAVGHLESLWHTCYEHYLDGRIPRTQVETAARWEGEKDAFLSALCTKRLARKNRNFVELHNFYQNIPDYVRKRIERKALRAAPVRTTPDACPDNGGQCPPTEQNRTEQKPSAPNQPEQGEPNAQDVIDGVAAGMSTRGCPAVPPGLLGYVRLNICDMNPQITAEISKGLARGVSERAIKDCAVDAKTGDKPPGLFVTKLRDLKG